jgi:hypothetical protein
MINLNKFIKLFFLSAIAIAMSACVPKVVEKKAVCGTNQAFNNMTRSCISSLAENKAAVAANITIAPFLEDIESGLITLSYYDYEIDLATACQIISASHVTVTQACSCDVAGVCTVKVKGDSNYNGAAQFSYAVKTNNVVSNTAVVRMTITAVNDAPVISSLVNAQAVISDITISEDNVDSNNVSEGPVVVPFYISDVDSTLTCAGSVTPSVTLNAPLVSSVVVSGDNPNCLATITPATNLSGNSIIRLQVTDGVTAVDSNFGFNVTDFNDPPLAPKDYISFFSQSETFLEEQTRDLTLGFTDVDSYSTNMTIQVKVDTTTPTCSTGKSNADFTNLITNDTTNFTLTVPGPSVATCTGSLCSFNVTVQTNSNFTGNACLYYVLTDTDIVGGVSKVQSVNISVTPINDTPLLSSVGLPTITALQPNAILEDLDAPSLSFTDIYAGPGGGVFEASQTLTVTALSSNTALVPNVSCQNYTVGAGAPASVPSGSGIYYFDKTNYRCYVSTGMSATSDWQLYPSLTVYPSCPYTDSGAGSPLNSVTPTAAGVYYLDTGLNQCYLSSSTLSSDWTTVPNYKLSYVPVANQSGTASITVNVMDNGGTANAAVDNVSNSFVLTVTSVDDPPYFNSTIVKADTNEGGMVIAGPFKIDEDKAGTVDEDIQPISITSITSDNPSVLPSATNPYTASSIRLFYDLNDNGVEDSGEERNLGTLETPGTEDANAHAFYLKLFPVAGVSGNANIAITATDGTSPVTTTFSLVVHSVAALHGGWENISSVGIKSDKNGAPVSVKTDSNGAPTLLSDIKCNYNKSTDVNKCDSNQNCTIQRAFDGTILVAAPHGVVTPDAANVLYWDSANKKCYRSQSSSKFSWVDVTTSCPITRVSVAPTGLTVDITAGSVTLTVLSTTGFPAAGVLTIGTEQIHYTAKTLTSFTGLTRAYNSTTAAIHIATSAVSYTANGQNFIKDPTSTPVFSIPIPTAKNQYYFDAGTNYCHISTEAGGVITWNIASFVPSTITLNWKPFTVTGSGADSSVGISGWNVYRREAGHDYDFQSGFLKMNAIDTMSITGSSIRTFTDSTAIAGTIYYYLVRPVDSTTRHLTISTPEVFSEVRIFAPKENYAFVHRWMANQEVCNSMLMTTTTTNKVDPTHNYRCPYKGPGESLTTPGYYDIGRDMLVDVSEVGCPYTAAPACTSNGCIGIGSPTSQSLSALANSVYYDRSSGYCYINNNGTTGWTSYTLANAGLIASASEKVNSALNPPLTNISQASAVLVCAARDVNSSQGAHGDLSGVALASLPTKKEFIAYAAPPFGMSDSNITDLEQGFSLNVQSRCNSTNANGLESAYTDSTIPSTSYIYSIPGTSSSSIRSIYTGSIPWVNSYSTEACSSRYGIQDVYGNVSEWVQDKMTCNPNNTCSTNAGTDLGNYNFDTSNAFSYIFGFDKLTGPYNDADADGAVGIGGDLFLTNWDFRDELYGAGKFSFPVGMPINVDIATAGIGNLANSGALPFLLDIGPTSGITTSQLHEDGIIVNGAVVYAGATKQGSFSQGGSYLSGNRSGRFSSELVSDAFVGADLGFRCYIPIDKTNFPADTGRHTYSY